MKKLATLLAGIALAATLTTAAYAQAAGPNGGGVQDTNQRPAGKAGKERTPIAGKILKQLNLTVDQQKQIKQLVADFVKKRQQQQQSGQKPNRKEVLAMRKQFMEDLSKILTAEQRDKLKQLMEEAKKKKQPAGTPPPTSTAGGKGGG